MMDEQSLSFYFSIYKNQLIRAGEYGKRTEVVASPSSSSSPSSPSPAVSLSPSSSPSTACCSFVPAGSVSEWSYIHHQYNYVPWHRYWLSGAEVPYVFHFFNVKPWDSDRKAYLDLEAWWSVRRERERERAGARERGNQRSAAGGDS